MAHEEGRALKVGSIFRYEYNLTDHLGNVRVSFSDLDSDGIIDTASGEVLQLDHYYPFGMRLGGLSYNSGTENRYRYNGKEYHHELNLGLYDYGARMYDPSIGRWNGVDVQAEEYFPISSYAYVANNPIRLIDPNGEEIWIYYGEGDEEKRVQYTNGKLVNEDGSEYEGDDNFVSSVFQFLDILNSVEKGEAVVSRLSESENSFDFKNRPVQGSDRSAGYGRRENGGGVMNAAVILNNNLDAGQKLETLAHELFHAYQQEETGDNVGGSVNDEVGAYLYGRMMRLSTGFVTNDIWGRNDTREGPMYQNAMSELFYNPFSYSAYEKAVKSFKNGSSVNRSGLYNNQRVLPIRRNPPIRRFLPVF